MTDGQLKKFDVSHARVVDLFCGIGGLTYGFVSEGFDVVLGIDNDESCRYAYETNNRATFSHRDISTVLPVELTEVYGTDRIKILVGCAPCQAVSKYNRHAATLSEKYAALKPFSRLVGEILPEIVSMENVPELRKSPAYPRFVADLISHGYQVWAREIYCPDYGVPQTRTRLVLLASRLGEIEMLPPTHTPDQYSNLRSVIGELPALDAGASDSNDRLHVCSRLNALNARRIAATPEGGGWRDWEEELRLDCHKKESGHSYGSVYGRMSWDSLAPTMTTQCNGLGNGRFGHPDQNRAISLREAALIQSFPSDYRFVADDSPVIIKTLARQIGNAVPVNLGKAIARSVGKHLEVHHV